MVSIDNLILKSDLLKMLSDDTIDVDAIVARCESMKSREKYLKQHKNKIWLASDEYWKTKVKGDDGKLRLIKKKNKSDLEDAVIEFYMQQSGIKNTFKNRFNIWVERQIDCGRSENTILKYKSDYRKYFEGYPIEKLDIENIDEQVLSKHFKAVMCEKEIRWRSFKDVMGYVDGTFEKAVRDRVIDSNPCQYMDLPIFRKYCYVPPVKTTKERTLTENDIHTLINKLHNPRAKNVNVMSCFAIELALYTGMRVGELSALMWEDVIFDEGIIVIRHSEKYNRISKVCEISTTKTGKERVFPIIDDVERLLKDIMDYEMDRGWFGDYVFMDSNGRLTKSKISDSMRNQTMTGDFSGVKSIHAIRRTFNSRLKCSGVSGTVASSLLGHTERVNDSNYTYDVADLNDKKRMLQAVSILNSNHSNPN